MSDELERLRKENAELKVLNKISAGGEPDGIWPANMPKYRVIRKGPNRGEIVDNAFVLLPMKHERDRLGLLYYAELCRADGLDKFADSVLATYDVVDEADDEELVLEDVADEEDV